MPQDTTAQKQIPCVRGFGKRLTYWKVKSTGNMDTDSATGSELAFWVLMYLRETHDYTIFERIAHDQSKDDCLVKMQFWRTMAEFAAKGSLAMNADMLILANLSTDHWETRLFSYYSGRILCK